MDTATLPPAAVEKKGAPDSGAYFRYMAEFVGLTAADVEAIQKSKPYIEKHISEIVAKFYSHLLRYPPTRKVFQKPDGTIDQAYLELRMRHLSNFWLRTASGVFDDDYASFIDYVGRAHTSHGADPHIYIAERYVIGQVGFMQHAISMALSAELREKDADFELQAVEAWDKLMMVLLEMLSRAYGNEREADTFDPLVPIDQLALNQLAEEALESAEGTAPPKPTRDILVGRVEDIPEGGRKIVVNGGISIGVFLHNGTWYALKNSCLHRGGPVCTGAIKGDVITCPWHGFQYNLTNGQLLVDPNAKLEMYPVTIENGEVHLRVPDPTAAAPEAPKTKPNEFRAKELAAGQVRVVQVDGQAVAVYNVGGTFFATQEACTHMGGPLSEGTLTGQVITCPLHGSRFDVTSGQVVHGPATRPVRIYRVTVDGEMARVEKTQ